MERCVRPRPRRLGHDRGAIDICWMLVLAATCARGILAGGLSSAHRSFQMEILRPRMLGGYLRRCFMVKLTGPVEDQVRHRESHNRVLEGVILFARGLRILGQPTPYLTP
uniref:(northern house mosquito) hypothetical protein n=1 Tax=Culex pipiens TaxID=7175 RepID=A0A8D8BIU3_CULPI